MDVINSIDISCVNSKYYMNNVELLKDLVHFNRKSEDFSSDFVSDIYESNNFPAASFDVELRKRPD